MYIKSGKILWGGVEQFEWDEAKYRRNVEKHGLGFELVERFDWSSAKIAVDDRYDYGEVRGLFGGVGTVDVVAFLGQVGVQQVANNRIVIDDQYPRRHCVLSLFYRCCSSNPRPQRTRY